MKKRVDGQSSPAPYYGGNYQRVHPSTTFVARNIAQQTLFRMCRWETYISGGIPHCCFSYFVNLHRRARFTLAKPTVACRGSGAGSSKGSAPKAVVRDIYKLSNVRKYCRDAHSLPSQNSAKTTTTSVQPTRSTTLTGHRTMKNQPEQQYLTGCSYGLTENPQSCGKAPLPPARNTSATEWKSCRHSPGQTQAGYSHGPSSAS